MTRKDWLTKAEEIERTIDELMAQEDAGGSYADYLHHKAQNLRALAIDAPEEEDPEDLDEWPMRREEWDE